jgi:cell wall-associated NlpC family hydrolase
VSARDKAIHWALEHLELPVLMGYRGKLRFDRGTRSLMPHGLAGLVFDCSGFVAAAMAAGGAADMSATHNAQMFHDETRELGPGEGPRPGDLGFYGADALHVVHVVMWLAGGSIVSADGATWGITTLEQAKAAGARVRLHPSMAYRREPYQRVRRNVYLDAVDNVTR